MELRFSGTLSGKRNWYEQKLGRRLSKKFGYVEPFQSSQCVLAASTVFAKYRDCRLNLGLMSVALRFTSDL